MEVSRWEVGGGREQLQTGPKGKCLPEAASLPVRQKLMHTRTHFRIQLNRCQETKQVTPSSPPTEPGVRKLERPKEAISNTCGPTRSPSQHHYSHPHPQTQTVSQKTVAAEMELSVVSQPLVRGGHGKPVSQHVSKHSSLADAGSQGC